MNKKILITGSTGFVGSNVLPFLKCYDFDIIEVSRKKSTKNDFVLTYEEFFNNDPKCDVYLHFAGYAHDIKGKSSRDIFFEANYELTKNVYEKFKSDKFSKTFIYLSSMAVVGSSSHIPIDEDVEVNPNGFYGESKYEAEKYLLDNIKNTKKNIIILRPPMIHGPNNKGNLNLIYSIITSGFPWPLYRYKNSRTFLSIDNFNFCIGRIINNQIKSGIYNISDDCSLSTNDIVDVIEYVTKKSVYKISVPKYVIRIISKIGNIIPIPINEDRLSKLTENYLVSNNKIKKALEINKMPVNCKDGMIKTISHLSKKTNR